MPTIEKISVALPGEMVASVREAVNAGEYASSSEVIRDALREWKAKRALREQAIQELGRVWDRGLASGPARSLDISAIKRSARRRLQTLKTKG
jgi:antitoxin ParD1/3/4